MLYLPATADSFTNRWYSDQLRAAREPRLHPTGDIHRETYRFTWIPSFDPTVVIRVERRGREILLTGKRLTGAGGYEPGTVGEESSYPLSQGQWIQLLGLLEAASFWIIPSDEPPQYNEHGECRLQLDGAQWLLEAADSSRYHYVDRSFIESYPEFTQACLCLLDWSGLSVSPEVPPPQAVLASVDWNAEKRLAEEKKEEKARRQQAWLDALEAHNDACRQFFAARGPQGLTCPHCRRQSTDIQFTDRAADQRKSFFVCRACGRSFGHDL